jgi:hypothetical protein
VMYQHLSLNNHKDRTLCNRPRKTPDGAITSGLLALKIRGEVCYKYHGVVSL